MHPLVYIGHIKRRRHFHGEILAVTRHLRAALEQQSDDLHVTRRRRKLERCVAATVGMVNMGAVLDEPRNHLGVLLPPRLDLIKHAQHAERRHPELVLLIDVSARTEQQLANVPTREANGVMHRSIVVVFLIANPRVGAVQEQLVDVAPVHLRLVGLLVDVAAIFFLVRRSVRVVPIFSPLELLPNRPAYFPHKTRRNRRARLLLCRLRLVWIVFVEYIVINLKARLLLLLEHFLHREILWRHGG
mmetsp:Transcript_19042/g.50015  ORF Transcript_19042/g.50015 Transcript_19042/m.50015 type:complete len:245 (+) Transcript_19042:1014-1748(+)